MEKPEFAHSPILFYVFTDIIFSKIDPRSELVLLHPGISIIPFAIHLVIAVLISVTSINFYQVMEPIYNEMIIVKGKHEKNIQQ